MGFRDFFNFNKKPAPVQRVQWSLPPEMILRTTATGQVQWMQVNSQGNIDNGYLGNHVIFTIQDWKSSKVASAPPLVYEIKDKKQYAKYRAYLNDPTIDSFRRSQDIKIKALVEIENHEMQKVLDRPNPHMTRYEFEYGLQTYLDIVGHAEYMGVRAGMNPEEGKIMELYLPPAHLMTIETGTVNNPIQSWFLKNNPDKKISAKNVCQLRNFSPQYQTEGQWLYGLSRLYPAKGVLQKYKDGEEVQISTYQNNGRQDIIFPKGSIDGNDISIEQMEILRQSMETKLKSGGISLNTVELGSIRIGFSPSELGILESSKDAKADMCALYHIPPDIFGWGEQSTYNNLREFRKIGLTDAVLPELEKRKDVLNAWLAPSYGDNLVIDYDYEYFPELQADNAEIAKWIKEVPLTGNEKRAIFGYGEDPGENSNKLLIPNGYKLLDDMGIESFAGGFNQENTNDSQSENSLT